MVVGTWRVIGLRDGLVEAVFVEGTGSAAPGHHVACASSVAAPAPTRVEAVAVAETAPSQTDKAVGVIVPQGLIVRDSAWVVGETSAVVVGAESADEPAVEVEDDAIVDADVLVLSGVDPGSAVEIDGDAQVLRPIRRFDARTLAPDLPVTWTLPGEPENCRFDSEQENTIIDDRYCEDFTLEAQTVVRVLGNIVILVQDKFEVEDGARLVLSSGSILTLITRGTVKISNDESGSGVNPDGRSTDFVLLHQGDEAIVISGRSRVRGRVFAQKAGLYLKNRARFQGAFSGLRLLVKDEAGFEITEVIAEVRESDIGVPVPVR